MINETTSVQAASAAQQAQAAQTDKANAISADFETFLKMLTVQMQNQDPLNPMDSADYAVQLATFSGVEQQVQTNDLLKEVKGALNGSGLSDLSGWIGKEVPAAVEAQFNGSPLTLAPEAYPGSVSQRIEVRDSAGTLLQKLNLSSAGLVDWAGVGDTGAPLGPGQYKFTTVSTDGEGKEFSAPTSVYQKVVEVRLGQSGAELVMAGGSVVAASQITAIRQP